MAIREKYRYGDLLEGKAPTMQQIRALEQKLLDITKEIQQTEGERHARKFQLEQQIKKAERELADHEYSRLLRQVDDLKHELSVHSSTTTAKLGFSRGLYQQRRQLQAQLRSARKRKAEADEAGNQTLSQRKAGKLVSQ